MGDSQPTPSRDITPSGRRSRLRVVSGLQESLHSRSFIHPELAQKLKMGSKALLHPYSFSGIAGPTRQATHWIPKATIKIGGWKGHHHLLIADLGQDLILGLDFWRHAGLAWNGETGEFAQGKGKVSTTTSRNDSWTKRLNDLAPGPSTDKKLAAEVGRQLTWERGDPLTRKARQQAFRQKERRKAKFALEGADEAETAEAQSGSAQVLDEDAEGPEAASPAGRERRPPKREGSQKPERSWREDEPFRLEKADGSELPAAISPEKGKKPSTNEEQGSPVMQAKVCFMVQFRSWLKKGEVDVVYAVKVDQRYPPPDQGRANTKQPEQNEIELPSERLQPEGLKVDRDVQKLLDEFADVFRDLPPGGVKNREIKHRIPTVPGELPNYPKQCYNLSDDHLKELKAQLKELMDKGFIAPSQSPIAALVFFVGKKDGFWRMVIDHRALNGITIKDEYPIPRIHDLINRLGRSRWYSKLDLQAGYHQVEIAEEDQCVIRRGVWGMFGQRL